ncbi:MAG TPA: cytochrome b/b6 domain-containing protein [Caulobacteraceae bacterium]|nr:cytochrome b/b6 domain-containing protein [Caulobacteraceae bacterium]
MPPPLAAGERRLLWDKPTRLLHWLIVGLVAFSWWSATHEHLPWHRLSGYTILGLLLFRVIWGFVGARSARFGSFLRGPVAAFDYVRGRGAALVGHSPLGGWSIVAMLVVLFVQVGLGLFSVDEDGLQAGPLSRFLSPDPDVAYDRGRAIAHLHHLNFRLLLALIALHLAAVAFYAVRGRNLLGPMITGRAALPAGAAEVRPVPAWRALASALLAAALAVFVARGLRF